MAQEMVSREAAVYEKRLQGFLRNFSAPVSNEAINSALEQTSGFGRVTIVVQTEEEVRETPGPSQGEKLSTATVTAERTDAVMGEAADLKNIPPLKQEAEEGASDGLDDDDDFDEEEPDEDAFYIGLTAAATAGEALDELLEQVIREIGSELTEPPDPQVLRWLVLDDPGFAETLDDAKTGVVRDLKSTIAGLLKKEGMVET